MTNTQIIPSLRLSDIKFKTYKKFIVNIVVGIYKNDLMIKIPCCSGCLQGQ